MNKIKIAVLNINEEIRRSIKRYDNTNYFCIDYSYLYNDIVNIHYLNEIILQFSENEFTIKEIEEKIKTKIREINFKISKIKFN